MSTFFYKIMQMTAKKAEVIAYTHEAVITAAGGEK